MRRTLRASYTVEAAILMPVVLILVGTICQKGIGMYQQTRKEFETIDSLCKTEPLETISRLQMAEDVLEELGWK